jgi:hypothetical protein
MKRLAASDDAKATIATARQMGVSVKMVTGDALAIAQETAKKLGMGANILDAGSLGDEKQQKTMAAAKAIENADGFAQVFLAQRPPRPIRAGETGCAKNRECISSIDNQSTNPGKDHAEITRRPKSSQRHIPHSGQ